MFCRTKRGTYIVAMVCGCGCYGLQHSTVVTNSDLSFIRLAGGKRNEELILPINSSLSVTLHQDQVSAAPQEPVVNFGPLEILGVLRIAPPLRPIMHCPLLGGGGAHQSECRSPPLKTGHQR